MLRARRELLPHVAPLAEADGVQRRQVELQGEALAWGGTREGGVGGEGREGQGKWRGLNTRGRKSPEGRAGVGKGDRGGWVGREEGGKGRGRKTAGNVGGRWIETNCVGAGIWRAVEEDTARLQIRLRIL